MDKRPEQMSESGRQFAEIFDEWNDPIKIAERKMKEQREKRAEQMRLDVGL